MQLSITNLDNGQRVAWRFLFTRAEFLLKTRREPGTCGEIKGIGVSFSCDSPDLFPKPTLVDESEKQFADARMLYSCLIAATVITV